MSSDFYTTKLSPEAHLLPGIGFVEYLYDAANKHLTINIGDNEVRVVEGAEARRIYFEIVGMNEDVDPDEALVAAACRMAWRLGIDTLKMKTRVPEIKELRQIVMWWMKTNTKKSLADIGLIFGQCHSTVLSAIRRIANMYDTDAVIKARLNEFELAIKQL